MFKLDFFFKKRNERKQLISSLEEGAYLIDVRSPQEFEQGTIEGATNIPLDELFHSLRKLDLQPNVVVFCRSGNRSRHAKNMLEQNGISRISDGGGIEELKALIENLKNKK